MSLKTKIMDDIKIAMREKNADRLNCLRFLQAQVKNKEIEVRPATNEVVVGPREALALAELAGARFSWAGLAPDDAASGFDCDVQVRAHADPVPATARVSTSSTTGDDELVVNPVSPIIGVAPGQTVVLYQGTRVLGQFTIDRTVSAVPANL